MKLGKLILGLVFTLVLTSPANAASLSLESGASWKNKTGIPKNKNNAGQGLVLGNPGVVRIYGFDGQIAEALHSLGFEGKNSGDWIGYPRWVIYLSNGSVATLFHYNGFHSTGTHFDWTRITFSDVPTAIYSLTGVHPSTVTIERIYLIYTGSGLTLDNLSINGQVFGGNN